jgi:archaellum component FlaC
MNGFRRFFNKVNKESISKDSPLAALIKKEYMMDHTGLVKLDRNYFQAHIMELIEEYLNAVPNLTISDEERLRFENRKKQEKINELEQKEARIQSLEKTVEKLAVGIEILKQAKDQDVSKSPQDKMS